MNSPLDVLKAQLPGPSQANRLLRLHTPLGPDRLIPEFVCGWEGLSEAAGFRLEVTALSTDARLDTGELIGAPVLLELLTDDSRTELRPWHAHVTACECLGSNQGAARYRLVLEPWLALLDYSRDSFVFQNLGIVEIVERIFSRYADQAGLIVDWRWELAEATAYPTRSLTTQFGESDLAFVRRLLAEAGLFYWFEHSAAVDPPFGNHRLIIADHNGAFTPRQPRQIRFQRADATEPEDSVQQWRVVHGHRGPARRMSSWDYRSLSTRPLQAAAPTGAPSCQADEYFGQYAYPTQAHGERWLQRLQQADQAWRIRIYGEGTQRRLAPGLHFQLTGHAGRPQASVCVRVAHRMRNNFSTRIQAAIETLLGGCSGEQNPTAQQLGRSENSHFYNNSFVALNSDKPFRPEPGGLKGQTRFPGPVIRGLQSAIVIGPAGAAVYTDRDHRVKLRFHWQRGAKAHDQAESRQGEDSEACGTWVRVAAVQAGANWGSHFIPRVGQEVLVCFIDGDIDRPMVLAAVYNGTGVPDAQHNQVARTTGAATANAPAWFAGGADGQAHAAVFSGYKSQALAHSQSGDGGYNQLVFDDSPRQLRVELSTTQYAARLALGHIKRQVDNQRLENRGHGAELATTAFGAARAGRGLLLTTEPGSNKQLSTDLALAGLDQAQGWVDQLEQAAQASRTSAVGHAAGQSMPVSKALAQSRRSLEGQLSPRPVARKPATALDQAQGGEGAAPAWTRPDLVLTAPAGMAALTPGDQIMVAGGQGSITAEHINVAAGTEYSVAAAQGITLFTQGRPEAAHSSPGAPAMALHAATGKLSVQAQSAAVNLAAAGAVTLTSTQANVEISASDQLQLAAYGAGLRIRGANITLTARGAVTFHAGEHVLAGPRLANGPPVDLSAPDDES